MPQSIYQKLKETSFDVNPVDALTLFGCLPSQTATKELNLQEKTDGRNRKLLKKQSKQIEKLQSQDRSDYV